MSIIVGILFVEFIVFKRVFGLFWGFFLCVGGFVLGVGVDLCDVGQWVDGFLVYVVCIFDGIVFVYLVFEFVDYFLYVVVEFCEFQGIFCVCIVFGILVVDDDIGIGGDFGGCLDGDFVVVYVYGVGDVFLCLCFVGVYIDDEEFFVGFECCMDVVGVGFVGEFGGVEVGVIDYVFRLGLVCFVFVVDFGFVVFECGQCCFVIVGWLFVCVCCDGRV